MKILAFVDIHGSIRYIENIIEKSKRADILVCAGDLTNWGVNLDFILKKLLGTEKPLIVIHGNHELSSEFKSFKLKNLYFIHKKQLKFNNYTFFGFGGGGFSLRDLEFEKTVKRFEFNKKLILVTHAPPYNTKLDKLPTGHHGNKSIKEFIEDEQPILHICGHLHETAGSKDKINKTIIINPGPEGIFIEM